MRCHVLYRRSMVALGLILSWILAALGITGEIPQPVPTHVIDTASVAEETPVAVQGPTTDELLAILYRAEEAQDEKYNAIEKFRDAARETLKKP